MERAQHRPPKKLPNYPPNILSGVPYEGPVVTIGMVENKEMAELLSWYAGPKALKSVVVETNDQYKYIKNGLRINHVPVYTQQDVMSWNPPRSEAQRRTGKLPLPPVNSPGFVAYAVNEIRLREKDEHRKSRKA